MFWGQRPSHEEGTAPCRRQKTSKQWPKCAQRVQDLPRRNIDPGFLEEVTPARVIKHDVRRGFGRSRAQGKEWHRCCWWESVEMEREGFANGQRLVMAGLTCWHPGSG